MEFPRASACSAIDWRSANGANVAATMLSGGDAPDLLLPRFVSQPTAAIWLVASEVWRDG